MSRPPLTAMSPAERMEHALRAKPVRQHITVGKPRDPQVTTKMMRAAI